MGRGNQPWQGVLANVIKKRRVFANTQIPSLHTSGGIAIVETFVEHRIPDVHFKRDKKAGTLLIIRQGDIPFFTDIEQNDLNFQSITRQLSDLFNEESSSLLLISSK